MRKAELALLAALSILPSEAHGRPKPDFSPMAGATRQAIEEILVPLPPPSPSSPSTPELEEAEGELIKEFPDHKGVYEEFTRLTPENVASANSGYQALPEAEIPIDEDFQWLASGILHRNPPLNYSKATLHPYTAVSPQGSPIRLEVREYRGKSLPDIIVMKLEVFDLNGKKVLVYQKAGPIGDISGCTVSIERNISGLSRVTEVLNDDDCNTTLNARSSSVPISPDSKEN